jgi:hypothetical protein
MLLKVTIFSVNTFETLPQKGKKPLIIASFLKGIFFAKPSDRGVKNG